MCLLSTDNYFDTEGVPFCVLMNPGYKHVAFLFSRKLYFKITQHRVYLQKDSGSQIHSNHFGLKYLFLFRIHKREKYLIIIQGNAVIKSLLIETKDEF